MMAPQPTSQGSSRVDVRLRGSETVVVVRGSLDDVAARTVYDAIRAALDVDASASIEIDLRAMDEWTSAGLRELAACTGLGIRVRMGPHVVQTP
jgi:chloramphenicol 3-O-phosphotransferase